MHTMKLTASIFALGLCAIAAAPASAAPACEPGNGGITLPKGFCAMVAADGLGYARHAVAAANGDLYVALRANGGTPGGVVALHDSKGDGHFDVKQKFGTGNATGVALHDGYLYVAQVTDVIRYKMTPDQLVPTSQPETVVSGFDARASITTRASPSTTRAFSMSMSAALRMPARPATGMNGSPGQDPCPVLEKHSGIWKFDAKKLNQKQEDGTKIVTGLRQEPDVAWGAWRDLHRDEQSRPDRHALSRALQRRRQ